MNRSDFIILLARPRSGTNALRSLLQTNPDIFCLNEVFSLADCTAKHPMTRNTNFFNFLVRYAGGDITRVFPDKHESLFCDYFDFLRSVSPKKFILIDVKYNTTHFLTPPYKQGVHPYLFDLIRRYGVNVLNVTRRNYLRYCLSQWKAEKSGTWGVTKECNEYMDSRLSLNLRHLLKRLEECDAEDRVIREVFAGYRQFLSWDYAEIFPDTSGTMAVAFRESFSKWLGVTNRFSAEAFFKKQSSLPLKSAIENYDEVEEALKGSRFEYCLTDEPSYCDTGSPASDPQSEYGQPDSSHPVRAVTLHFE